VKKQHVVVELLPGHIDVVHYDGGQPIKAQRLPIVTDDDALAWAKTVRRSAVSLRALVQELGVSGLDAVVLYRSPTQSVDMSGFAVRASAQAVDAATLGCADSLPYSTMSAICEATIVGRDAQGEPRQTHVVVAAEREDIAEAIVHLVQDAGLQFISATPLDAAVIAQFVGDELREKARHGALYIGEHTSFFVVVSGGRLLFSRRIDLGIESLVSSLTGTITIPGRAAAIDLTSDEARAILLEYGIPDRDTVINEEQGMTGAQVVPVLQPALQRFVVELRQSIRFGLDEQDRADLALKVTGPGSTLPGLSRLIGRELSIETEPDPGYANAGDWFKPGASTGERADATRDHAVLRRLNLMPRELARMRRNGRLRRWLLTGTAAALVGVGVDGFLTHSKLAGARLQAGAYTATLSELKTLEQTRSKLAEVIIARDTLEKTIAETLGPSVDYHACVRELSRITPSSIRFLRLDFNSSNDTTTGSLSGYAFSTAAGVDTTDLSAFIDRLEESPLFDGVTLGNVHKGTVGDRDGQRFQATFEAVSVPPGTPIDGSLTASAEEMAE